MIADAIRIAKDALCKPFEGYAKALPDGACKAYPDPATGGNPWTIGYGSTGPDINPSTTWTKEQAENALDSHLLYFATQVSKLSPTIMMAEDRRFAAIISFAYNCGVGNYRVSTLKKRVDSKDWAGAAEEIVKWNKAAGRVLSGLTKRRQAEALLLS